jgi:DNA-binding MarR family transcriptional regulator
MSQIIRDMTEITRCGVQYRTDTLAPLELKACHASYLRQICAEPGISQDRLAERICINKSNVARQAAVLEEGGFIIRTPSTEDKRVMGLFPTEKTLALLPRLNAILDAWEECLTRDIDPQDLEVTARVLEQMRLRASAWLESH